MRKAIRLVCLAATGLVLLLATIWAVGALYVQRANVFEKDRARSLW